MERNHKLYWIWDSNTDSYLNHMKSVKLEKYDLTNSKDKGQIEITFSVIWHFKAASRMKKSLKYPLTDDSLSRGLLNKDFSTHSYTSPHKIPEAWKRYPFWAMPPSIGLYREYPAPDPSSFFKMNILVLPFTWNLFGRSFALQISYFFGFYKKESFLCKFYFGHCKY